MSVSGCVSVASLEPSKSERFTIGELAREFGITARALRFYEEEELIAPERDGSSRLYSRRDRVRVAWILRGKSVGFSLDEIGELLDLYDLDDGRARQRAVAVEKCRDRAKALRGQIAEIERMIAQLDDFVRSVDDCG